MGYDARLAFKFFIKTSKLIYDIESNIQNIKASKTNDPRISLDFNPYLQGSSEKFLNLFKCLPSSSIHRIAKRLDFLQCFFAIRERK